MDKNKQNILWIIIAILLFLTIGSYFSSHYLSTIILLLMIAILILTIIGKLVIKKWILYSGLIVMFFVAIVVAPSPKNEANNKIAGNTTTIKTAVNTTKTPNTTREITVNTNKTPNTTIARDTINNQSLNNTESIFADEITEETTQTPKLSEPQAQIVPETQAPIAPETQAPVIEETQAPIIEPVPEPINQEVIVYWIDGGEVYHSTPNCRTLAKSKKTIRSGTIDQVGRRPCKVCY